MKIKIWIDDVRTSPDTSYYHCHSVNEVKHFVRWMNRVHQDWEIVLIDIDHDAGDFVSDGGDYIKVLDWMEKTGRDYPIHIHSMNPVGVENMRRIIQRNNWKEV